MTNTRSTRAFGGALCATFAFVAGAGTPATGFAVESSELPVWPLGMGHQYYGQEHARAGTVTVEFVVGPDGVVYEANTARMALPKSKRKSKDKYALEEDFDTAAINAMYGWRFRLPADACGTAHGKQRFTFDGSATPDASEGTTEIAEPDPAAVSQVLAPVFVSGTVADPMLADRNSMARRMRFEVLVPPAISARAEPLAPKVAPTGDLEPATLDTWAQEPLVAAADPHVSRQLVIARFTIGVDGRATGIELDRRYGDAKFEAAVRTVLDGAKYRPAKRAGAPVAVSACQSFGSAMRARPPAL